MRLNASRITLVCALIGALAACEQKSKPPSGADATTNTSTTNTSTSEPTTGPASQADDSAASDEPVALEPHGIVQEAELRDLPGGVVDGDTLKAVGYAESLRLLNVNTEELLHRKADRARAAQDWEAYLEEETEGEGFETFGTPMGQEAKEWAREYFTGVDKVWLEYQSPIRTKGFFGRHLVYVWTKEDGAWRNYNLEAVRRGMSAYYTKYGYSERYHDHFVKAQEEARAQQRGIWAPGARSYPDYDARMAWWNERADQIALFKEHFDDNPRFVDLGTDTAASTLRTRIGRRMVVFGEPKSFKERGDPQRIRLSYRYRLDFPIVSFDPIDMTKSGVDPDEEEYIYVEGVVGMYRGDPQLRYDEKSWMSAGKNPPVDEN